MCGLNDAFIVTTKIWCGLNGTRVLNTDKYDGWKMAFHNSS